MKKILSFVVAFAFCGILLACGDSGGSSSKSGVTILADGQAVNNLNLLSGQSVELEAILKDSKGNVVEGYTTAWTKDWDSLGTFLAPSSSSTVFNVGDVYTNGSYITADCNGVKRKIKVVVESFSISISMSGSNSIVTGATKNFKATATYKGQPYTGTVVWGASPSSVFNAGASFSPATTQTGQDVTFTAPNVTGTMYVTATIEGVTVSSLRLNIINQ